MQVSAIPIGVPVLAGDERRIGDHQVQGAGHFVEPLPKHQLPRAARLPEVDPSQPHG